MDEVALRRGDWVTCLSDKTAVDGGWSGVVVRLARDGSWADVDWGPHRKRMRTADLRIEHTLRFPDGTTVTDVKREEELRAAVADGR